MGGEGGPRRWRGWSGQCRPIQPGDGTVRSAREGQCEEKSLYRKDNGA